MELTEPVLLGFWDGRSEFVCQCPEKEREKEQEEVEGEVNIKRLQYQLGHIVCGFIWSKSPNDLSNFNETFKILGWPLYFLPVPRLTASLFLNKTCWVSTYLSVYHIYKFHFMFDMQFPSFQISFKFQIFRCFWVFFLTITHQIQSNSFEILISNAM